MAATIRPGHEMVPSKQRKSCDPCAAMKVACTKERPRCSRCAKRGQSCVYGAVKRAGRPVGAVGAARPPATVENNTPLTPNLISPTLTTADTLDSTPMTSLTPPSTGLFTPSLDLHSRQPSPSYATVFASVRSPGDTSLSLIPANSFIDFDNPFASTEVPPFENLRDGDLSGALHFDFDFGLEDFSDHGSSNFTDISGRSSTSCLFPGSSKATTATPPAPGSQPLSSRGSVGACPNQDNAHVSINITEAFQARQPQHLVPPCQCLVRALGLLAQFFPVTSGWGSVSTDNGYSPKHPDFERVIAQNQQTNEVIEKILQCGCSNDSYLLVILSLITFKIIAWYTAAASATSGEDLLPDAECQSQPRTLDRVLSGPLNQSDYDSEGEDQQRKALQLILSKLAGVQLSVDQLSQRLQKLWNKTSIGDKARVDPPLESANTPSLVAERNNLTPPYSAEFSHTLLEDLRERLYELSRATVERLRKG